MNNPLLELNSKKDAPTESSGARCSVCFEPIERTDYERHATGWVHSNAGTFFKPCFGRAVPVTPPQVSSPAYHLPEVKSEAEIWADNYIRTNMCEHWLRDHLVDAYNAGLVAGGAR